MQLHRCGKCIQQRQIADIAKENISTFARYTHRLRKHLEEITGAGKILNYRVQDDQVNTSVLQELKFVG